jgi:diguanylate cyclase (GGDEF)-like protein
MFTVLSCIVDDHNNWLVIVAALVCVAGSWAVMSLFGRAVLTAGLQRAGWLFLTAVAAGSSIWCTHFIAMLAYDPGTPVHFDPVMTIMSLIIAMAGTALGFSVAASNTNRVVVAAGGSMVGLAIVTMHYTGMLAYRVQGSVSWDMTYLVTSVALSVVLSALALHVAMLRRGFADKWAATAIFVLAIVTLHFTGMTAFRVTPMMVDGSFSDPAVFQALALGIAGVALLVVGTGVASYVIDGKVRSESVERLRHMALNDSLTGVPNRAGFSDRLQYEIDLANENESKIALIAIDLDRFKDVNDARGHSAGDEVLKTLARRMSDILHKGEFVARIGGDEFAALHRMRDQADLLDFLSRLEAVLSEPIRLDGGEVVLGASLGVAIFPDDAGEATTLINNADLAMYRAKADLTKSVCFYERAMDETVRARRALAAELRDAVENDRLEVHYQVQTSIPSGEIRGYEALLRWNHPSRGYIPPTEFIPIAEESGLILRIGEWVLRTACTTAASWAPGYKVAVNLSALQFAHADLPKLVLEVLMQTGLSPDRLELELTESTVFADKVRSLHILRRIKSLGVTVALDDFGTGYSSLETLRSFPFDKIKLDRSFMNEVESSPQAKAIIRAVLALGKSLEIPVLAEGIETEGQLAVLSAEGCDEAQGFLLGRPSPLAEIVSIGQITLNAVASTDVGAAQAGSSEPAPELAARVA